jgi:general secretion pathway protein G
MTESQRKQRGFSLLELLVAMMIIAVLGTLGFRQLMKNADKARYLTAQDKVKIFSEGLDQYYLKHGKYPDVTSWQAGIDANSPLVKQNLIPANMPAKDPWDQDYEVKSGKGTYEVKCLGNPNNQEEYGEFKREPGKITGIDSLGQGAGGAGATPAGGTAPAGGAPK